MSDEPPPDHHCEPMEKILEQVTDRRDKFSVERGVDEFADLWLLVVGDEWTRARDIEIYYCPFCGLRLP